MPALAPRHFIAAYVVTAAVLIGVVPSVTVPGDAPIVPVHAAAAASPVDLSFATSAMVTPTVPRRPSAPSQLPDPADAAPVRISIPSLGIDGPVTPVGIAVDRQLDVPGAQTAGWYRHSALPAAEGAMVIAAHVDYGGSQALFFNLRLAEPGDTILLEDPDGSVRTYQVETIVLYDKAELPSAELFRATGAHALHLVTCGGTFDPEARSYRGNQVVTAVPI